MADIIMGVYYSEGRKARTMIAFKKLLRYGMTVWCTRKEADSELSLNKSPS
jgi:hypothetical protein